MAVDTDTLEALEVQCRNCGASLRVEPRLMTAQCPYCASTSIVQRPTGGERADPSFALGFVVDAARARELCVEWIRSRGPFTKAEFKRAAPAAGRGLYLPAYLLSAVAHAEYTVSIGEDYTETYTTTDSKGNAVVRTRTVTEWRGLSGRRSSYVNDVLVTASKGISNELLERVEPFDMRALLRYTPAIVSGWIAEEPSLSAAKCVELARSESVAKLHDALGGFMPGDHHRALDARVWLEDEVSDLVLLPVWVFAVRHSEAEDPIQILINGQTGEVAGDAPRSWVRIAVGVLLGLALLAGIGLLFAALAWGLS